MSDSKGAAIDKILGRFHDWEMYVHYPEEIEPAKGALKAAQAKKAILAILAQEVKNARIDELTLINARFSTVRGAPKHKEMIEGYMLARDEFSRVKRERITELERLG